MEIIRDINRSTGVSVSEVMEGWVSNYRAAMPYYLATINSSDKVSNRFWSVLVNAGRLPVATAQSLGADASVAYSGAQIEQHEPGPAHTGVATRISRRDTVRSGAHTR